MGKNKSHISAVRAAAGRKGAAARWGKDGQRATECVRLYPATAKEVRRRAQAKRCLPADIVKELVDD